MNLEIFVKSCGDDPKFLHRQAFANSADPDQTAPLTKVNEMFLDNNISIFSELL